MRWLLLSLLVILPSVITCEAQPIGRNPLDEEIEIAIKRGVRWLLPSIIGVGAQEGIRDQYPMGEDALCAYALLEAGVDPGSDQMGFLLERIANEKKRNVYSMSLAVLALNSAIQILENERGEKPRKGLESQLLGRMRESLEWLLAGRHGEVGTWGYTGEQSEQWADLSNTQFAILAVHAGFKRGLRTPARILNEMEGTLLSHAIRAEKVSPLKVDRIGWIAREEGQEPATRVTGLDFEVRAVEWGYRLPFSSGNSSAGGGTQSMTCAGVSSLLAVRQGSASRLSEEKKQLIDETILGGLASISKTIVPWKFSRGGSFHRNRYYHLYSLEKALDLAGIATIDGVDWYRHITPGLLKAQGGDGAWGHESESQTAGYRRMATAFSLLFLERATQSLSIEQALPTFSGKGIEGGGASGAEGDLARGRVRIASLGGAARISDLIEVLKKGSDTRALGWLREAVEGLGPELAPRLLPDLCTVLDVGGKNRKDDSVKAIVTEITAITEPSIGSVMKWHRLWLEMESVARGNGAGVRESLEDKALDGGLPQRLRARACLHLARRGDYESVPKLIVALGDPEEEVREVASPALRALTGEAIPFEASGTLEERGQQQARWQSWWDSTGAGKLVAIRFGRLRDRLERATDLRERSQIRAAVLALGPEILPHVEAVIASRSFAFDWLEIRNFLEGNPRGL